MRTDGRVWRFLCGPFVFLSLVAATLSGLGLVGATETRAQQTAPTKLEAWKAQLRTLDGGVWLTSNATYQVDKPAESDNFGMAFTTQPGGMSATGCLWGEKNGEVQVVWRFFQGWDPVRQAGLIYQSHWSGGVGMGYQEDDQTGKPELIQDFWWPDGSSSRIRHTERLEGDNTRVSQSMDWTGERWEPRRIYTWVRNLNKEDPCKNA